MDCSAQPVVVAVRIRPLSAKESNDNEVKTVVKQLPNEPQLLIAGGRGFAFDYIFNESAEQSKVYELIKPRLESLYQGYNSAIIAYGQTGTGKTYTIGTEPKYCSGGILEQVVKDVLSAGRESSASVMISFIEIYNEEAYDLLGQHSKKLLVQGFTVQNLTCLEVTTYEEARRYLVSGASNRHTRSTKMNACSSRSHAIFTVYYRQPKGDMDLESRINLVDLAGSESVRNTGNKGDALIEASNINRGLLHVGRVIANLSEKHSDFISYRSSLLTTVLKDSLSQKSYITMIACVSPSSRDIGQTITTLRFAEQAKKVMTRPKISSLIHEYKTSNPEEFEQLSQTMEQILQTPLKSNKGKCNPTTIHPRKPFASSNWIQSTPSIPGTFKRPNLNLSTESMASSQLNSSSASSVLDALDLSPIIRRHVEEARKVWMNEIPVLVRSELERTFLLGSENEAMKENFATLQNTHQTPHEDSTDFSETVVRNNIRRSIRLAQKSLLHSLSVAHSDKSAINISEEVNNTVVRSIMKRANLNETPESPKRLQTSVRRLARLATTVGTISSTPESGSGKIPTSTAEINSATSAVSPPILNRDSDLADNANEKNDFSEKKEDTSTSDSDKVITHKEPQTIKPRRSIRILSLKERQDMATRNRTDHQERSTRVSRKKAQGSLHAISPKSRRIAKQNCTCTSSKELLSQAAKLSPVSRVKKQILDLLNGKLRDLVKLPTVGPKRAFIIYNYRLIKDISFTQIEDLKDIPGLPNSFYEQFVQANCMLLTKDEPVK